MIDVKSAFPEGVWDWTQLIDPLGLKGLDDMEDEPTRTQIVNKLWDSSVFYNGIETWPNGEAELCREFLRKLSPNAGYSKPIIDGFIAVENDFTFMQWFTSNLTSFWS